MTFVNVVKALFTYKAQDQDELAFQEDDLLCVLEQDEADPEWLRACELNNMEKSGLIPCNYVATVQPCTHCPPVTLLP